MLFSKTLTKLLNPIYHFIHRLLDQWRARQGKKRSERALNRLDDHLLDDIGLRRVNDVIVSIKQIDDQQMSAPVASRKHQRLRHPYLLRYHARRRKLARDSQ